MAHGAARPQRPGGAARCAGAVLRRPLHARAEVGAARARDPGRDARARAGQRVHRARPSARRRQRASPAGPRRCATRSCAARSSCRERSPAARSAEEGARLLAAEWALDDRDAPRAIELLNALPLGVARRTHALRLKLQAARLGAAAAGGAEDRAPAGQAPGLLDGRRRRPGALARLRVARRRRTTSTSCAALWLSFDPADRRDPFIAARAATRGQRARRARGSARLAAAVLGPTSPSSAVEERAASREALVGGGARHRRRMAAAPRVGVAGPPARRRGRARRRQRAGRARLWGKARALLEQAARDVGAAAADAPQGLDRARRAGRAGGRRGTRRALLRERRAPGLSGSRCYNRRLARL